MNYLTVLQTTTRLGPSWARPSSIADCRCAVAFSSCVVFFASTLKLKRKMSARTCCKASKEQTGADTECVHLETRKIVATVACSTIWRALREETMAGAITTIAFLTMPRLN